MLGSIVTINGFRFGFMYNFCGYLEVKNRGSRQNLHPLAPPLDHFA